MTTPLISVAPMMDRTDRHDRYFLRMIAPDVQLYTEMITTHELIHGNSSQRLAFHQAEKYVALQLGGNDPEQLAYCAQLGEQSGYDEINLNVGCPSNRVCAGRFGVSLMLEPQLVAASVAAMQKKVTIPVTVKCRIGVDNLDSYEFLHQFIQCVADSGCRHFIIHARKAWLSGLSPKQNREIPPLSYARVIQIKQDFPQLTIILNGGVKTVAQMDAYLPYVDGIMLGRAVYSNPYLLAQIQTNFFNSKEILTRHQVIEAFIPYVREQLQNRVKLPALTRHILGLFQGQRGAAAWRRFLSQHAHKTGSGVEVIEQALACVT